MSFAWFIARRYLTARRRQAFISLISAVSIVGVGVGVMALIIALALMTGVQGELRDRIVGSSAHVYVYKPATGFTDVAAEMKRLELPGVIGAAPAVLGLGLLQSSAATTGSVAQIKGIDPDREQQVTDIRGALKSGSLEALTNRLLEERDGVILGEDLARELGVRVRDTVTLVTPHAVVTPAGAMPMTKSFQVVATVRFGFYETDHAAAFMTLESAERVLGKEGPDIIQLKLSDLDQSARIRDRIQSEFGFQVQDWTDLNGQLYSALRLEKLAISLTIGLIVMVAALNIVASLVLLVMEKNRDIAILRTMGAPARAIRLIFILQGVTIGLIGTLTGTVLGLAVCFIADKYQLISLPSDVYQITYLPFRVQAMDVAVVVVAVIGVCLAATIYPSRQAGRLDPAEALRHQ